MMHKFAFGLIGLSYSYGFCRGWTLPIWSDIHKASFREVVIRIGMSIGSGIIYIIPPFCFTKYIDMYGRLRDRRHGLDKYPCTQCGHWQELGIYHPRTF